MHFFLFSRCFMVTVRYVLPKTRKTAMHTCLLMTNSSLVARTVGTTACINIQIIHIV